MAKKHVFTLAERAAMLLAFVVAGQDMKLAVDSLHNEHNLPRKNLSRAVRTVYKNWQAGLALQDKPRKGRKRKVSRLVAAGPAPLPAAQLDPLPGLACLGLGLPSWLTSAAAHPP